MEYASALNSNVEEVPLTETEIEGRALREVTKAKWGRGLRPVVERMTVFPGEKETNGVSLFPRVC